MKQLRLNIKIKKSELLKMRFKFLTIAVILVLIIADLSFANLHNGEALKTIDIEQFIAANPTDERKKIIDFIVHQFDKSREVGITQEKLDKLWNNKKAREAFSISRFQIVNQQLYADSEDVTHPYFTAFFHYFQKFIKKYKVNDVDFIIYTRDEIPFKNGLEDQTLNIPAFMNSKDLSYKYEKDILLLPDAFMLHHGWGKIITRITAANANEEYSWDKKMNKIFWRGGTTGLSKGAYHVDNFDKLPRLNLVILSKLYPDLIDARFTYYMKSAFDERGKSLKQILDSLFGEEKSKVREEDHLKYKYLISLDGNTCTGTRVPWIMLSNSVLMKQETPKMQFFYSALQPYVNYIPVNERLTDILSQFNWMKEHDKELQNISKNAHNFVENNLMPEDLDAYMAIILNEYSKIQKDSKITPSLPKLEDVITMPALLKSLFNYGVEYLKSWLHSWI